MNRGKWAILVAAFVLISVVPTWGEEYDTATEQEAEMIRTNAGKAAGSIGVGGFTFEITGGFGSAYFKELVTALDGYVDEEAQWFVDYLYVNGSDGRAWVTYGKPVGGWEATASAFYSLGPRWDVGLRTVYFAPGEIVHEITGTGVYGERIDVLQRLRSDVTAVLAGARWVNRSASNRNLWTLGLMAGPAFARSALTVDDVFTDPYFGVNEPWHYTINSAGNGVYVQFSFSTEYALSEQFGIVLGAGYHYCAIPQMKATGSVDWDGDSVNEVEKGDVMQTVSGRDVWFNFSGIDLNAGLKFTF